MLKPYLMDLHIHTCLSPCGESDMVPTRIVSRARQLGLDAIAVCDHNASENVHPVRAAGLAQGLAVFMGMEVTSREEIHVLALFGEDRGLELMQKLVESNLHGVNDEELFGPQYIVDERDYVSGVCERLLIGATDLSVEAVVEGIHRFGGLAVASHVDRGVYSVISQLGFIPPGLALDAIELSPEGGERRLFFFFGMWPSTN
jgi:hypothetical protein